VKTTRVTGVERQDWLDLEEREDLNSHKTDRLATLYTPRMALNGARVCLQSIPATNGGIDLRAHFQT